MPLGHGDAREHFGADPLAEGDGATAAELLGALAHGGESDALPAGRAGFETASVVSHPELELAVHDHGDGAYAATGVAGGIRDRLHRDAIRRDFDRRGQRWQ